MKKFCSIFLAFAISFLSLNIPQYKDNTVNAKTESTVSVWNGSNDTSWYDDDDDEFHLYTAEEFAGFKKIVNNGLKTFEGKIVYLENDLDMGIINWESFCRPGGSSFKGTFDGKMHTISNLKPVGTDNNRAAGIFVTLDGTVKNLNISNLSVIGSSTAAGGICNILNNSGTINNCILSGSVKTSSQYTGGIVGYSMGNITNCKFEGELYSSHNYQEKIPTYAGGICGFLDGKVDGCSSNALIKIDTTALDYYVYGGGICGKTSEHAIIQNSYNRGDVFSI